MTFLRSRLRLATVFLATSCAALAMPGDAAATDPATPARAEIVRATDAPDALDPPGAFDAIVLGIVEGVTEYLPVSSTGHLVIANHILDLESTAPLYDGEGRMLRTKKPSPGRHPEGEPLTIKAAADAYAVIIQAGAIAAVGLIYWRRFLQIARGLFGNSPDGVRLLRNIVLACIPPGLAGLLLGDFIDNHLFSIRTVAWALVVGSVLMVASEAWRKRQPRRIVEYTGEDLKAGQALFIGFAQCLALWPGMSRSMVTMVAGYFTGMKPARSAEFSFLAGFALLSAAALYKSRKAGPAVIEVFGWSNTLLGMLVATIAAVIAIKGFVGYLSRHGLGLFAIYRLALAAILFVWFV